MTKILNETQFQEILENEDLINEAIAWFLEKGQSASNKWLNDRSFEIMMALCRVWRLGEAENYIDFAQNEKWRLARRKYIEKKWEILED